MKKIPNKIPQLSGSTRQLILVALVERYNENLEKLQKWQRREGANSFLELLSRWALFIWENYWRNVWTKFRTEELFPDVILMRELGEFQG